MFYTYVLLSTIDNEWYIGSTVNLKQRLKEHNQGLVNSTKHRRPFKLIYYEACLSLKKARKREQQLKTGYGRKWLKKRLSD